MKKRLVSLMLAIMMVLTVTNLSACGRKELADQVGIDTSVVEATEEKNPLNVQTADVACDKQLKAVEVELLATQVALQEANATVEGLNTKVSELTNANADLQKEIDGIEVPDVSSLTAAKDAEIAALKAEIEALKAEKKEETPKVEVINGVVYCDVDYFLERATVNFVDGTAALKAIKSGTSVVLDDVHAIGERAQYRDNTFVLPRKDYKVAVTFDGAQVYVADFGNYHWATNSLFLESTSKTGYPLTETEKSGKMGNFDQLLQVVAVCVPNARSEYGYDFYVATGWNEANPVPKPQPQPEKEVVVKTEIVKVEVCMICGKENCPGHVETKVETKVETEIVKIEVCMICGKENCPGHVETKVETNTVYVDRVVEVEKEVIVEVEKEVIIEVPVIVPTPDDNEPENNPDPSVPEKDPCEDPDEGDKEPENNPDPSEPEKDPCEDPDTTPDEDDTDGEKDPCEDPENNTPEDDTSDEVKDPCEDPENNEDPSKSEDTNNDDVVDDPCDVNDSVDMGTEDFDPCDTPVDEEVDDPCDVDNSGNTDVDDPCDVDNSGNTDVDDPCDSDTTEDTDVDDDPCGSSNVDNEEEFDPCA